MGRWRCCWHWGGCACGQRGEVLAWVSRAELQGVGGLVAFVVPWEAWAHGLADLFFPELLCGCCRGHRKFLSTVELSFPHFIICG